MMPKSALYINRHIIPETIGLTNIERRKRPLITFLPQSFLFNIMAKKSPRSNSILTADKEKIMVTLKDFQKTGSCIIST